MSTTRYDDEQAMTLPDGESIGIINAGPRRMLGLRGDSHPATPRPRPGNVHLPRGDRNVSARRCPLGRSDLAPAGAGSQGGSVGPGGGSAKEHPVSAVGLGDRGRCGWGRAGPLGGERAAEVSEDGAGHGPVLDGGDDAQPAATAGTGENIEIEHAVHQRRPGPGVRGDGGAGAGLELAGGAVWGRAAVADDLRAPACTGSRYIPLRE